MSSIRRRGFPADCEARKAHAGSSIVDIGRHCVARARICSAVRGRNCQSNTRECLRMEAIRVCSKVKDVVEVLTVMNSMCGDRASGRWVGSDDACVSLSGRISSRQITAGAHVCGVYAVCEKSNIRFLQALGLLLKSNTTCSPFYLSLYNS